MMARSLWPDAWRQAGSWALGQMRVTLGDAWVERCWGAEGRVPGELLMASGYTVAFGFLLEWALRLHLLQNLAGMGYLRRALRKHLDQAWRRHAALQLEVAALGLRAAYDVRLEGKRTGGSRPADVTLGRDGADFTVEAFALLLDAQSAEAGRYDDRVAGELMRIEAQHGVSFDGSLHRRLGHEELADWVQDVEKAATRALTMGTAQTLATTAGDLTIRPPGDASPTQLTYPVTEAGGWHRTVARLRQKAKQARASGAEWLRADLLDGIWWASSWSRAELPDKTSTMAGLLREALADDPSLAGVVVSSSPCPALSPYVPESARSRDGSVGLTRVLPLHRVRETIIVPLRADAEQAVESWLAMYDGEPEWLGWGLAQVGLPSVDAIVGTT
jgi:hypothetical protein